LIILVSISTFPTIGSKRKQNKQCKQRCTFPTLLACVAVLILALVLLLGILIAFVVIERGEIRTLQDSVSALEKKELDHLHNNSLSTGDENQLWAMVASLNESKIAVETQLQEMSNSLKTLNDSLRAAEKQINEKIHTLSTSIEALNYSLNAEDTQLWEKMNELISDTDEATDQLSSSIEALNDSLSATEM